MVLNITKEPLERFSCAQRLALKGENVTCAPVNTIEDFEEVYENTDDVSCVLVDAENFILANDVLNYVACPVYTMSIEVIGDMRNCNFVPYNT